MSELPPLVITQDDERTSECPQYILFDRHIYQSNNIAYIEQLSPPGTIIIHVYKLGQH